MCGLKDREKEPACRSTPHRRPNWVAGVDGRKNSRVAGGLSAFSPSFQPRLPMWGSDGIIIPEISHVKINLVAAHRRRGGCFVSGGWRGDAGVPGR